MINKFFKFILDLFFTKNVEEKMKEYIEKKGYPDEDVVFCDHYGRISKIIGKNTFIREEEKLKYILNKKDI